MGRGSAKRLCQWAQALSLCAQCADVRAGRDLKAAAFSLHAEIFHVHSFALHPDNVIKKVSLLFELFQNLYKGTKLPWLHNLFTAANSALSV